MYTRSIAELFSKFKTGDRPSQEDFRNLIFSLNSPNYIGELKFINNNFNGKLNFFYQCLFDNKISSDLFIYRIEYDIFI